jgi:hypothetical protein
MSENTQIPAAQNPAENPSNAAYSDSNWKSDFDAVSEIQYIVYLLDDPWVAPRVNQQDLTVMKNFSMLITTMPSLCDPFVGLNPSDAAKLIASLAQPFIAFNDEMVCLEFQSIISACKDIDPSS